MTVIKINAITVPADSGDELARRFAARAGAVDGQAGFEGFELLKPTDPDRHTWLVVTRWADEESFDAWVRSPSFAHGHAQARADASTSERAHPHAGGAAHGSGRPGGDAPAGAGKAVGLSAELWSYEIVGGSTGRSAP